ncbi:GNAT family N-acetyltransferase, partial [Klebsiella aerogenes]
FRVVAEQRVESRGEWFTNYRMEKRGSGKAE